MCRTVCAFSLQTIFGYKLSYGWRRVASARIGRRTDNPTLRRSFCSTSPSSSSTGNTLMKQIKSMIDTVGHITVADYMKIVLTNVNHGYYMHNDVFGVKGDFTTSPEISQMFGELIGIWCINEWMQCGKPTPFNVVEFGPGRGTLADDMLRVFKKFPEFNESVSLHLIEISPKLKEIQRNKLCSCADNIQQSINQSPASRSSEDPAISNTGVKVHWWNDLFEVPSGPGFYVAHEFFDALPIHKFQKAEGKWREVLIDHHDDHLRFVLSPSDTRATALMKDHLDKFPGDHVEISAQGLQTIRELSQRIEGQGGFALVVDYGHLGEKGSTFRAFNKHRVADPLLDPGSSDLTADVNFELLKSQVLDKVKVHGPVNQSHFLCRMGITVRLQILLQKASAEQRKDLITGYDMLTNPKKMGERFKFMALSDSKSPSAECTPAGFEN